MKLFRSILDNDIWFEEPFTRAQAWVDLLLIANHKDGVIRVRGNKIKIKRGQVGWSQKRLADRWKWSRGKVSRFLQELEETERQIEQQKNPITTLITIINYEKYNGDGQQTDSKQATDGQQTDTNKKVNKVENEKKEEKKSGDLTPQQQRIFDRCQNMRGKIIERFPHVDEPFDIEVDKCVAYNCKRNIGADPSLVIWRWFERIEKPKVSQVVSDEDREKINRVREKHGLEAI